MSLILYIVQIEVQYRLFAVTTMQSFFSTNFITTKTYCYTRKIWRYKQGNYNQYRQKLVQCNLAPDTAPIDDQISEIMNNIVSFYTVANIQQFVMKPSTP